ncbi:cell division topological specificity factor [Caldanaerobius fijiensis DSM 17918]|uniref:Cell division topological specificity factor n=1 Tax=Caldanaerobius fijiensis DSM 17918 TaxID=1121256 RepID=A0A1M4YA04_9THEO|nr:cell division topological specificity factor MinE [Caldanaerobius fijiensis]SHF02611.1 cell division topological specificity factor [Caldanaerobius fijiensis DSM 17918]
MFNKNGSKNVAKERLKNILINDRVNTSIEVLDMIKEGIINVISNYMEADNNSVNVKVTNLDNGNSVTPTLVANIPIKNIKHLSSK